MKCKCLRKVEKLEKWKVKPEVDVKDKEVVDHIGVIAVLRVLVYNPGSRFIVNWRRKNRHKKVKWETWRVGGASPHWSPCWKMLLLETRNRYKREDTCVSIFQTLQDWKKYFFALILIDWTQLERCEYYNKIDYSGLHQSLLTGTRLHDHLPQRKPSQQQPCNMSHDDIKYWHLHNTFAQCNAHPSFNFCRTEGLRISVSMRPQTSDVLYACQNINLTIPLHWNDMIHRFLTIYIV